MSSVGGEKRERYLRRKLRRKRKRITESMAFDKEQTGCSW